MKLHLPAAIISGILSATADAPFRAPALVIGKSGEAREILLTAVGKDSYRYLKTADAAGETEGRLPDDGRILLCGPQEYADAMDLYQARRYGEAKAGFIEVKQRYQPVQLLEDGPVALAAFHEMECLRKLGDLDGLAAALQNFPKGALTRETQLRQMELYVLWDAVRTKSWERLEALAGERANARLPGDQRAQVAYCHGLALEGLNRSPEALAAYQTAMIADSGSSEDIARLAALRVLAIHKADPEVQKAIKAWGTTDEKKNSRGYSGLLEAAAVAELFELSLGAGTPLPADYKSFLKYQPRTGG